MRGTRTEAGISPCGLEGFQHEPSAIGGLQFTNQGPEVTPRDPQVYTPIVMPFSAVSVCAKPRAHGHIERLSGDPLQPATGYREVRGPQPAETPPVMPRLFPHREQLKNQPRELPRTKRQLSRAVREAALTCEERRSTRRLPTSHASSPTQW